MLRTRHLRNPLPTLLAAVAVAVAVACALLPAGAGAVSIGIGENNPSMFDDSNFKALGVREARIVVPWDVATRRADRPILDNFKAWLAGAKADRVTPLVSFGGDGGSAGNYVPSTGTYLRAVKAFLRRFPSVHRYTAWNEPDWPYRSLSQNPALAASYFNVLVDVCHRCTVLAGDVFLPTSGPLYQNGSVAQLGPWLRSYLRYVHHNPRQWALHDYYDARGHSDSQVLTMLELTKGTVWLTETGGVLRRGHWQFADQSANGAASDERWLLHLAVKFPRIGHIFHYGWASHGGNGWDSGLVTVGDRRRPAYNVLLHWLKPKRKHTRHHR